MTSSIKKTRQAKVRASPARRSQATRVGLSTDVIVEAACELIAESHTDQLTMRRLSERLGVALGATYHYVPDRESLLLLVAERINHQITLQSTKPSLWSSTLRQLMIDYAAMYGKYPGMASFVNSQLARTAVDERQASVHDLLISAGFEPESALCVLATFFFYVSGATASELMHRDQPGYSAAHLVRRFEKGLDLVVEGAKVQLRADKRARSASNGG